MPAEITEIQVACFSLAEELFAVDIMRIREIIRPLKLTHLVKMPSFLDGIINLRGTVIPVVNLRRRFDLPVTPEGGKLLVVSVDRHLIGLLVDDVTEVVTLPVRDIKPPPPVVQGVVGADCLLGVCLVKDQMISLLNIDRLLTSSEAKAVGAIASER